MRLALGLAAVLAVTTQSCAVKKGPGDPASAVKGDGGGDYEPLNPDAMLSVLYEVQVRAANACRTDTGSPEQRAACAAKVAPKVKYKAESWADHSGCDTDEQAKAVISDLEQIRLGTFDDMVENTNDFHVGLTLRYVKEKLGLNAIWIMPAFPNNDRWNIPSRCDNLGSPYAVRDYMHTNGSLSRVCIQSGKDEFQVGEGEEAPCYGDVAFDKLIAQADQLGLRVMMDVALNHFGHNYRYYDYADYVPTRERLKAGQNLDDLWSFGATEEPGLVHPEIVDTVAKLEANPALKAARDEVKAKCPDLKGDELVRATNMWRNMMDWERAKMACDKPMYLEFQAPGFYAGQGGGGNPHPSRELGDNHTNNWSDVKFLYHHEVRAQDDRGSYYDVFVRNREYFFRILNYWTSKGVQGFRLDHATDGDSGMAPNEWRYILRKVNHYDWLRKGKPQNHRKPLYLAEEFGDQMGMNHVVDVMTEGYVFDIRGGNPKDTAKVQSVLENGKRFGGHTLVMRALETHDEPRLSSNTGFNEWTGAGFWGIGATTWATPMLLMGQEFGESYGLGFRRSDFLRARFYGNPNHLGHAWDVVDFYGKMIKARFAAENHALLSNEYRYLPLKNGQPNDPRLFAMMKWWGTDVMFVFHNLWAQGTVEQAFYIPPEAADGAGIKGSNSYKLVNVLSGQQLGGCHSGDELKTNLYVKMAETERVQWLRLELCN